MRKPRTPRRYDASRRQQRAAENRERVLEVARRLFSERGYAETTMEAIARQAEVSLPTVYAAFHSKSGVLAQLLSRLVSGEPTGRSVLQTPGAQEVLGEPDPRRALAIFAAHMNEILLRVGPTHEAMKNAARTEPEVSELFSRAQKTRFQNMEAVAARLGKRGALRQGLSVEDAGRTIWVLASVEVRQLLIAQAGWSPQQYQAWLADTLSAALLA